MSDLDKEELRATKNMQSSAETAEKTADEMFEELGYIKQEFLGDSFYNKGNIQIVFDFQKNKVIIHEKNILEPKLIKAINKKCFELEWLDE